jgi:kelch-like protein 20
MNLPSVIREVAVASLGSKIFFAGWNNGTGGGARVDIYDNSADSWSTTSLSVGRIAQAATSVGNKILFAGGHGGGGYSGTVDIYDGSSNTWSVSALSTGRIRPKTITLNNKAFFAGGDAGNNTSNYPRVDIYDNNTHKWSFTNLPFGNTFFNAAAVYNKVLFFRMANEVSIYDDTINSWSIGYLDKRTYNPGVIGVGNEVYVAGGNPDNGILDQTNQVWKIKF